MLVLAELFIAVWLIFCTVIFSDAPWIMLPSALGASLALWIALILSNSQEEE